MENRKSDGQSPDLNIIRGLIGSDSGAVVRRLSVDPVLVGQLVDPNKRRYVPRYTSAPRGFQNFSCGSISVAGADVSVTLQVARVQAILDMLREGDRHDIHTALVLETDSQFSAACHGIIEEVRGMLELILETTEGIKAGKEHELVESLISKEMRGYCMSLLGEAARHKDAHSGLYTLEVALKRLEGLIAQQIPAAYLGYDMQHLGPLNTALGQHLTDKLLKQFFERMESTIRSTDMSTFRRQAGGDEGRIVLDGVDTPDKLAIVMKRIYGVLEQDFELTISPSQFRGLVWTYKKLKQAQRAHEKISGEIEMLMQRLDIALNQEVVTDDEPAAWARFRELEKQARELPKPTTKDLGALEFFKKIFLQLLGQNWQTMLDTALPQKKTLNIRLDMRLSGVLVPVGATQKPKEIDASLDGLEEWAKALQKQRVKTPLVLQHGRKQLYITPGSGEFRPLTDEPAGS